MSEEARREGPKLTNGEYRVGIAFNPGNDPIVDKIKRAAADLIDLINYIGPRHAVTEITHNEIVRLKNLAMTHIEDAAMWAVKAATKPPR